MYLRNCPILIFLNNYEKSIFTIFGALFTGKIVSHLTYRMLPLPCSTSKKVIFTTCSSNCNDTAIFFKYFQTYPQRSSFKTTSMSVTY